MIEEKAQPISEELLHSTRWLQLKTLTYQDESKTIRKWDCVERSTRTSDIDGVDIIATLDAIPESDQEEGGKYVILISQYRPPMRNYCIEFPAGLSDAGETAEETARREMLEETGLMVEKVNRVSPILGMEVGLTNANCKIIYCQVQSIKISERPKQQLEDDENITIHFVKLSNIMEKLEEFAKLGFTIDAKVWTFAFGIEQASLFTKQ